MNRSCSFHQYLRHVTILALTTVGLAALSAFADQREKYFVGDGPDRYAPMSAQTEKLLLSAASQDLASGEKITSQEHRVKPQDRNGRGSIPPHAQSPTSNSVCSSTVTVPPVLSTSTPPVNPQCQPGGKDGCVAHNGCGATAQGIKTCDDQYHWGACQSEALPICAPPETTTPPVNPQCQPGMKGGCFAYNGCGDKAPGIKICDDQYHWGACQSFSSLPACPPPANSTATLTAPPSPPRLGNPHTCQPGTIKGCLLLNGCGGKIAGSMLCDDLNHWGDCQSDHAAPACYKPAPHLPAVYPNTQHQETDISVGK